MSYFRVLPRDLFNEAKLLKCLGKISLLVHDEMIKGLNITHGDERKGFKIGQDCDGNIFVENLYFFDNDGEPVFFHTGLNDKSAWPLVMNYKDETYFPFNSDGHFQLYNQLFFKN